MKIFTTFTLMLGLAFWGSGYKVHAQILTPSVAKDVSHVFFPWNEWMEPRTEFSGRYAFQSYQVIQDRNQLCLLSFDSRLVIYDLNQTDQPKETIEIGGQVDMFYYSDGFYYCLRHNDILRVDPDTKDISMVATYEYPNDFWLQYYYVESGKHYFLTSDERTFILEGNHIELLEDAAWRHRGNYRVFAEIKPGKGVDIALPAGLVQEFSGDLPGERSGHKVLSAVPVGSTKDKIYLDVEMDTGDSLPTRILYTLSHDGAIITQSMIPFVYYIELQVPWCVVNDVIFYMLTTPEGFYLVKNCDFSHIKITAPYHYNYTLPVNPYEGEIGQEPQTNELRSGTNCVTRTQAVARAQTYLNMQWTAASANWVSNCTTIPGGTTKYRTPLSYSSNGLKNSVPYKWGGFTKWTDWLSLVNSGKKTGNYFTSNNSTCSGTAYSSDLDTYVIGVDCSGGVSRWWELGVKRSTTTLDDPDISTYLGQSNTSSGFSALKKGDIVNYAGSHTRMCINDNPTGTATFIEASGGNWNVQVKNYSYSELTGYKSYKYNNIVDSRLKLANSILLTPSTVNKNCPLTVNYKIKNEGTESWTGKVLLVLIQSNGVEVGLDGPYTVTLGPNQSSTQFTYSSTAFNYPTGTSKIEVRVKNNSTCNYSLYYPVESGSYQNPKIFTIYNNSCNAAAVEEETLTVSQFRTLRISNESLLPADIYLYDITGRMMNVYHCAGSDCEFDLGSIPAGLFIATTLQGGHFVTTQKLLIPE